MMKPRPSRISVTFLRDSSKDATSILWECAGVELCLNRCQGQVIVMSVDASLLSTNLQVGDVLETINGRSCHNVEITDVWAMVDGSAPIILEDNEAPEEEGAATPESASDDGTTTECSTPATATTSTDIPLVTLTFQCPEGCSDILCAISIPPGKDKKDIDSPEQTYALGLTLMELEQQPPLRRLRKSATNKSVAITELDGWTAQSVLSLGDTIVSVNNTPITGWSLDAVVVLISKQIADRNPIAILAKPTDNNNQRGNWGQRIRRASVKVGGGVMVGTGAVLMVTPLHPVGHALAIGGVAVLGGMRRREGKQKEEDSKEEVAADDDVTTKDSDEEGEDPSQEEEKQPTLTAEQEDPAPIHDETPQDANQEEPVLGIAVEAA
ncbi:expressed unknown protein [Seminavis robusta]|uniref:PDZ domain-containing protein n=1 Tax=Seminavis robusta TaxID=568900 RepID=A0A9N8EXS5_9STRA|nr:expressed unknown protein [Seminavis robusta]|eukprot:Sro1872_g302820.1 n/a (382) ;mRNA; r:15368-16513